ncbi:hypothetical protein [Nocardia brasiliensis]|uniref:hypothetical protein n=1 Tax=Nocardia brasiliensis TaxID=37326 RepID=UPI00245832BC|nr:hypothetical protein [Nocardia brasiliensis]
MVDAIEAVAERVVRVWDKDFNLVHTGEGLDALPSNHPVATHIMRAAEPVFITVDEFGVRWSGRLDSYSLDRADDGSVRLMPEWRDELPAAIRCYPNPFA